MQNTKIAKNSPSAHDCTILSSYIFATKVDRQSEKKLIKQRYLLHPHNMANFDALKAEIRWRGGWGHPSKL